MTSVTLLFKFNVSSFCMTGDIIDSQSAHFATLSSSKLIVIFLTLGKSKLTLLVCFYRLWTAHSYFTEFGLIVTLQKTKPILCLTISSRAMLRIWHKSKTGTSQRKEYFVYCDVFDIIIAWSWTWTELFFGIVLMKMFVHNKDH